MIVAAYKNSRPWAGGTVVDSGSFLRDAAPGEKAADPFAVDAIEHTHEAGGSADG